MTPVPAVNAPVTTAVDGFGRRRNGIDPDTGDEVEVLDLSSALVEHSGFVAALGERVARFAAVRHASYAHLRRLDRPDTDRLELISDASPGWRLSDLLQESSEASVPVDITIVIGLLRQLLPAVALYSRHNRDAAIGALAVERLIVTPQARLVIAEHAFGPALEKLNLGRERLWRDLRVAMPPSAGLPRANQRADANAIGVVALALVLGRPLTIEEYPSQLQALLEGASQYRNGQASPLSPSLANWIARALQFETRTAFQSPSDAQLAFETVLASDRGFVTSSAKLEEWVTTIGALIDAKRRPPEPEPEPEPPPPPPVPEPAATRDELDDLWRDRAEGGPEPASMAVAEPVDVIEPQPIEEEDLEPVEEELGPGEEEEHVEPEVAADLGPIEAYQESVSALELEVPRAPSVFRALETEAPEAEAPAPQAERPEVPHAPYAPEAQYAPQAADVPEVPHEAPGPYEASALGPPYSQAQPSKTPMMAMGAVIVVLLGVIGWLWTTRGAGAPRPGEGELVVQTRPVSARVLVDGKEQGVSPLTMRLPSGAHVLEVQVGKSEPRVIPLTIQANVQTAQYIELQGVATTGALEIKSEPSGARILLDGQPRGITPATIQNVVVGDHTVVLESGGRKVTQTIKVDPGSTAQLMVPIPRR